MVKKINNQTNFRRLREGTLIRIVKDSPPVVFERIKKINEPVIYDLALVVYLDPIDGLVRDELPLNEDGTLKLEVDSGIWYIEHSSSNINMQSEEGKKYLKLITGYNR